MLPTCIYVLYMFGGDKLYRGLMAINVFHAVCWLCIHGTSIFGALQTKRMAGTWKDMVKAPSFAWIALPTVGLAEMS
jgi:hypothetical protein